MFTTPILSGRLWGTLITTFDVSLCLWAWLRVREQSDNGHGATVDEVESDSSIWHPIDLNNFSVWPFGNGLF
jgi:hypothetical protein